MATTATLGILATYILVSLAGMACFWRTRSTSDVAYNLLLERVAQFGSVLAEGGEAAPSSAPVAEPVLG